MMRRLFLLFALSLALVLVGCEDGEFTPVDSPDNGGTREIVLVLDTAEPLTAGNSFTVTATVTEDGNPVPSISVNFTAVTASSQTRIFTVNPVETALISGTAETTVITNLADRSITVTASAGTASDAKTFTLEAAPR